MVKGKEDKSMVEKEGNGIDMGQASIEDLVLKRGVPSDRAGIIIEALYAAFGKDNQPESRIRDFLQFLDRTA